MKDNFRNVNIFITQQESTRELEDKVLNLLRDKAELEREIRAAEHAQRELKELDAKLNKCYKLLAIKNSSHE